LTEQLTRTQQELIISGSTQQLPMRCSCLCNDTAQRLSCLQHRLCWHMHQNPEYYQIWKLEAEMYPQ